MSDIKFYPHKIEVSTFYPPVNNYELSKEKSETNTKETTSHSNKQIIIRIPQYLYVFLWEIQEGWPFLE